MIFHSYVSLPEGTNWVTPTSMATVWPSPAWPSWPACPARLRGSEAACVKRGSVSWSDFSETTEKPYVTGIKIGF